MKYYLLKPYKKQLFSRIYATASDVEPYQMELPDYCLVCHRPVSPMKTIPPYQIAITSANPKKIGDFIFGTGEGLFISDKVYNLFMRENIKDIRIDDRVNIVKMGRIMVEQAQLTPPKYFACSVKKGGGKIDVTKSQYKYIKEPQCPYCQAAIMESCIGQYIQEGTWKGDDIFYPLFGEGIFITERLKKLLEEHNITGYTAFPGENWWYRDPGYWPRLP